MEITLNVDSGIRRSIQRRAEEIRKEKVANLERNSWSRQAEKLDESLEEMSEAEYIRYLVRKDLRENGYSVE